MPIDPRFIAFILVAAVLIGTPGPDTTLVVSNALRRGTTSAFATAWGVGAGSAVWALASTLGIAALLAASATAFTVMKLCGAAYLVYLGVRSIREGFGKEADTPTLPRMDLANRPFVQGLLNNLLNPKAIAIFLTALPQLVEPGDSLVRLLAMLLVYEVMVVGWLHGVGFVVARTGRSFGASALRRRLNAATGFVLIGLGARLALERR
jgi:threonine/homoserine/homoserine lactone efflux protein